ncbi:MAG: hypothetical protein ACXVIB_07355, partial [Halobacteriota archaeon]
AWCRAKAPALPITTTGGSSGGGIACLREAAAVFSSFSYTSLLIETKGGAKSTCLRRTNSVVKPLIKCLWT